MSEKVFRNNKEDFPFPIKTEYYSGVLKVKFSNNVERYIKVAIDENKKISLNPFNSLPKELSICEDGSVLINDSVKLTAQELWENGTLSVNIRPFI